MRSLLFAWCDSGWNASGHADVVVRAVRALGHHDVRRDARDVRLVREVDQVEHQLHLLVEVRQLADRRVGQVDRRQIALRRLRDAPLRLAHALEVVVEHALVGGAELALQVVRAGADHVEHARAALRENRALLGRVAGAEELREHLARVELHRQRRRLVAERQRRAVVARARAAGRALRRRLRRDLERGQHGIAADLLGDHLVDRRRHPRARGLLVGLHAREPRGRHDRVHGALRRLVLEVAERRDVALVAARAARGSGSA